MSNPKIRPVFICADCDWFVLEPGKTRTGACLACWLPSVMIDGMGHGAYGRTFTFNDACSEFAKKGALDRYDPERCGR